MVSYKYIVQEIVWKWLKDKMDQSELWNPHQVHAVRFSHPHNNYENIKEVEIEFIEQEKGNKVVSLWTNQEGEVII